MRRAPTLVTLVTLLPVIACSVPSGSPLAVTRTRILARQPNLPKLTGARPTLLLGQRAVAERGQVPSPRQLWESRFEIGGKGGWAAATPLFATLPSAFDADLVAAGDSPRLYFAAIPPRGSVPRIHQSKATADGAWDEAGRLNLPDQGAGAQAPDVIRDAEGQWWMAYASAGTNADVRIAKAPDGLAWQFVTVVAPGLRPRLAALADGRLVMACESGATVTLFASEDGATWTALGVLAGNAQPALAVVNGALCLATQETVRRAGAVVWRRSADGGRTWSSPQRVAGAEGRLAGLRWQTLEDQAALVTAPADGRGELRLLPVIQ